MGAHFSSERLRAFEQLLALADPRDMKKHGHQRGHHVTQVGDVNRMRTFWARSARTWVQHRIGSSEGVLNGWKPAEKHHARRLLPQQFSREPTTWVQ